jgi:hypothetical protein
MVVDGFFSYAIRPWRAVGAMAEEGAEKAVGRGHCAYRTLPAWDNKSQKLARPPPPAVAPEARLSHHYLTNAKAAGRNRAGIGRLTLASALALAVAQALTHCCWQWL